MVVLHILSLIAEKIRMTTLASRILKHVTRVSSRNVSPSQTRSPIYTRLKAHTSLRLPALEALPLRLRLRVADVLRGVGVVEAAARLAVLELGADARADARGTAGGRGGAARAAALLAVGVAHTATRGELPALAVADVPRARGVGGDGRDGGDGD